MNESVNKIWIEILFDKIPLHYLWISTLIFIANYIICLVFMEIGLLSIYKYNIYIIAVIFAFSFSSLLATNKYLINTTRKALMEASNYCPLEFDPYKQFNLLLVTRRYPYVIFFLILISYCVQININLAPSLQLPIYSYYNNISSILQGVYIFALAISFALLLSLEFWLLIILYNIIGNILNYLIHSNVILNPNKLKKLVKLTQHLIYKYFLLSIFSIYIYIMTTWDWFELSEALRYPNLEPPLDFLVNHFKYSPIISLLTSFFIFGVIVFLFSSLDDMHKIVKKFRDDEVEAIETKYHDQIQKLVNFSPSENYEESAKRLNYLSSYADILKKEQDRLTKTASRNSLKSYIELIVINVGTILVTIVVPLSTAYHFFR